MVDGPSSHGYHFAGQTHHYRIYYDKAYPNQGLARSRCHRWLDVVEKDHARVAHWFSGVHWQNRRAGLFLTRGGGATWGGANTGKQWSHFNTYVGCADGGKYGTLGSIRFNHVAELSEQFMMRQYDGWFSPRSAFGNEGVKGEALSMVCALETSRAIGDAAMLRYDGFDYLGSWLDSGRKNYLGSRDYVWGDSTTNSDSEKVGCGIGFIYWLMRKKHHSLRTIIHAGGADFNSTYRNLGHSGDPFPAFQSAVFLRHPAGIKWYGYIKGREVENPWA